MTTQLSKLNIHRLTKTTLDGTSELVANDLYLVDPEFQGGKILATDTSGNIVETSHNSSDITNLSTKEYAKDAGFPSTKFDDLTLGTSGTEYIAPANGWYFLSKVTDSTNQYISLYVNTIYGTAMLSPLSGKNCLATVFVKKGDSLIINYSAGGKTSYFRFIYAEGEV